VRYAQNKDKRDLFINMTALLPAFGPVGLPTETILGSAGDLSASQGCLNAQDGRTEA